MIVAVIANVSFSQNYKNKRSEYKSLFKRKKMFPNSTILMPW